jgi:hypothetical protein
MSQIYSFIFYFLQENKLKIFRWKLIQFIIPTKKLLTVWRLSNCSLYLTLTVILQQINYKHLSLLFFVLTHNTICIMEYLELLEYS